MTTTTTEARPQMLRKARARNGLQLLARLGVPEGALSALLIGIAVLTVLPHMAGREFGPYSVPDVLTPGVFWTLRVPHPLVALLLGRVFEAERKGLRRVVIIALAFELLSVVIAFGSSTTITRRHTLWRSTLVASERSPSRYPQSVERNNGST